MWFMLKWWMYPKKNPIVFVLFCFFISSNAYDTFLLLSIKNNLNLKIPLNWTAFSLKWWKSFKASEVWVYLWTWNHHVPHTIWWCILGTCGWFVWDLCVWVWMWVLRVEHVMFECLRLCRKRNQGHMACEPYIGTDIAAGGDGCEQWWWSCYTWKMRTKEVFHIVPSLRGYLELSNATS